MAGFASIAAMVTAYNAGKTFCYPYSKAATNSEAGNVWHSWWNVGNTPAAGGTPATTPGTAYSNNGINFPDTSSEHKFITNVTLYGTFGSNNTLGIMLYDRLVAVSNISTASTGDKTVSSTALTRYTDGVGVQAWLEVTTATTVTAPIITLNSYTDNDGNAGQTGAAVTFPAAATDLHAMVQLPLAAGDNGVRAISTVNVGTASTAGVVNVVLLKPLLYFSCVTVNPSSLSTVLQVNPPIRVYDGASLAFMHMGATSVGGTAQGCVEVVYS